MDKFLWIKDFLKHKPSRTNLKGFIPNHFQTYALIPWTIGIIDDFPFSDYPLNNDSIEDLNKQHTIQKEFGVFLNECVEDRYRRISLQELSTRFNVKYCAHTVSLIKPTPGVSYVYKPMQEFIGELVRKLKGKKELNLYVDDNTRFETGFKGWKFESENIFQESLAYLSFLQQASWDSTSYLFTENLNWCLCTIEDFNHFILCGDHFTFSIAKDIIGLEMFEFNYDDGFQRVCT